MKKVLALVLAAAMALSMVACGGGSTTTTSGSTATSGAASTGTAAAASDGTLKLILSTTDGSSTDDKVPIPWLNRTMPTNLMFRSLFIADSTLNEVSPDLAESYEVSEDGLTYTITLKDGLKWSDGEALTADDVLWSIDAALQTTQVNSIYTSAFKKIADKSAEGNVITLTLSEPYSSLPQILSQFAILPKHSLENVDVLKLDADTTFWQNPVTSGYYMVGEFNVGNYFTMVPNPNYEGTPAKIQKVTVTYVNDYLTASQSGNADYLYGNATDLVEAMQGMSNYTSHEVDVLFYKYFIFNMEGTDGTQNEAMQNVEVRKAIMEAIDRATLATLYPSATVLNSGVPDSNPAYNGFTYTFDTEKAKADIAASGYDMSRPIRICYYNNDQTSIDLINTIVYYLEQAGLTVESTLSNDGTTDLFTTRQYDIGFKGKSSFSLDEWYSEYLSTDALFQKIWGGDTSFDEAIATYSAATTEEEKNAALKTLQDLEQEKLYKVPLFTVGNYVFTSSNVKIPEGVTFCNPLYSCDLDFANWEMA